MSLRGINYRVCGVYSLEPRSDVYCFRLNITILKLGYCIRKQGGGGGGGGGGVHPILRSTPVII